MSACHLCFMPPVMLATCLFSLLVLLSANPCLSAYCRRCRRLLTQLSLSRSVLCSGSRRRSGSEVGVGRCRLTFTPGERWELWEQSVLVCWRRPACSVLHAWVWARGTKGWVWEFVRVEMRKRGEKLKISATEDTPRVEDSESVLALPNFPLCSVIRFCLKAFCMDADTIIPWCFDEASGNCTFLSSGEVFQSCKCTKILQREHLTLVAIV